MWIREWRSVSGDGWEGDEGSRGDWRGDLLRLVSHHRKGNVLTHVVQFIGYAVGPGDVDGQAVVMIPFNCKRHRDIGKYFHYTCIKADKLYTNVIFSVS